MTLILFILNRLGNSYPMIQYGAVQNMLRYKDLL